MMAMTLAAIVNCDHQTGLVANLNSQSFVRIDGAPILVFNDPVGRPIAGCPNLNVLTGQKPCLTTLIVKEGYSTFARIDGKVVCLDTVSGFTDGTPPGLFKYSVRMPGQTYVGFDA